ncbi:MAG: hypothetical protein MJ246_02035 [Clostridia bacterium]|nr:hypothetical protein [Clostridia bacterium]
MKDRTNKEVNNVYKNEYVYFNKKFPSNSDNKIMFSEDNGTSWQVMTDEKVRFMGDDTILVKQTLDYYYDSQEEEFKFHVITVKDVIDSLADEMNDSDVQTKKKDDIKKILDDERNIELLFNKDDPNEYDYNDKLSNPKDNNDNVDITSDYLSRNTVPDNLNDDKKKDFIKGLIKESLAVKDFADDITSEAITNFEEAMIKYE